MATLKYPDSDSGEYYPVLSGTSAGPLDGLTDVVAPGDTPPGKFLGTTAPGHWEPLDPPNLDTELDHGLLLGLGDDDHPQYLTQERADALFLTAAEGDFLYAEIDHLHERVGGQRPYLFGGSVDGDPGTGHVRVVDDPVAAVRTVLVSKVDSAGNGFDLVASGTGDEVSIIDAPNITVARSVMLDEVVDAGNFWRLRVLVTDPPRMLPAIEAPVVLVVTVSSGSASAPPHNHDGRYVNVGGDTMAGPLALVGNAVQPLEAVPLQQLNAHAHTLDSLTDVEAPTPVVGDALVFDGTLWKPSAAGKPVIGQATATSDSVALPVGAFSGVLPLSNVVMDAGVTITSGFWFIVVESGFYVFSLSTTLQSVPDSSLDMIGVFAYAGDFQIFGTYTTPVEGVVSVTGMAWIDAGSGLNFAVYSTLQTSNALSAGKVALKRIG